MYKDTYLGETRSCISKDSQCPEDVSKRGWNWLKAYIIIVAFEMYLTPALEYPEYQSLVSEIVYTLVLYSTSSLLTFFSHFSMISQMMTLAACLSLQVLFTGVLHGKAKVSLSASFIA